MAGDARIKVTADTIQAESGLTRVERRVDTLRQRTGTAGGAFGALRGSMASIIGVGSAIGAGFAAATTALATFRRGFDFVKGVVSDASTLSDVATQIGASAEATQRMQAAADLSGASLTAVAKGLLRAGSAAQDVLDGNWELKDSFDAIGVSAEEVAAMTPEERFNLGARVLEEAVDKERAIAALLEIYGRGSGSQMLKIWAQGSDVMEDLTEKISVISNENVQALDSMWDNWTAFWKNVGNATGSAVGTVARAYDGLLQKIADAGKSEEELARLREAQKRGGSSISAQDLANAEFRGEEIDKAAEQRKRKRHEETQRENERRDKERHDNQTKWNQQYWEEYNEKAEEAIRKEEEARERANQLEVEKAEDESNTAQDRLSRAQSAERNLVKSDDLRRIGGGFARSNYAGLSREAMLISKQVDYASKQLDELKKIVTELRKSDPLGGVTS